MEVQLPTTFAQQSKSAGIIILGSNLLLTGIRSFLKSIFGVILSLLVLPFLFIVGLVFWMFMNYVRIKLKKAAYVKISITQSNYKLLRKEYDMISIFRNKIANTDIGNIVETDSFLSKLFQFNAIISIIAKRHNEYENSFEKLNPSSSSVDEILIPINEGDLWWNRTKAYNYLA